MVKSEMRLTLRTLSGHGPYHHYRKGPTTSRESTRQSKQTRDYFDYLGLA